MPVVGSLQDRELAKFELTPDNKTGVRVIAYNLDPFGAPANSDAFTITYPTTTTEVYRYYSGGTGGTLLKTVTLTYSSPAKTQLISGVAS